MVNGAWSRQPEVRFPLQVFTIRQEQNLNPPARFHCLVRKNATQSDAAGVRGADFAWRWNRLTAYNALGAPITGHPRQREIIKP